MELSGNMYWLEKQIAAQNDWGVSFEAYISVLVQPQIFHLYFQAVSLQYTECIYIIHIYVYTTSAQQVFT